MQRGAASLLQRSDSIHSDIMCVHLLLFPGRQCNSIHDPIRRDMFHAGKRGPHAKGNGEAITGRALGWSRVYCYKGCILHYSLNSKPGNDSLVLERLPGVRLPLRWHFPILNCSAETPLRRPKDV